MRRNALDLFDQQKWEAIQNGDAAFDGVFFYGVRTTGVYCRPSCRSKTPLRKNVEFFETVEEAEKEGSGHANDASLTCPKRTGKTPRSTSSRTCATAISTTGSACRWNWNDWISTRTG